MRCRVRSRTRIAPSRPDAVWAMVTDIQPDGLVEPGDHESRNGSTGATGPDGRRPVPGRRTVGACSGGPPSVRVTECEPGRVASSSSVVLGPARRDPLGLPVRARRRRRAARSTRVLEVLWEPWYAKIFTPERRRATRSSTRGSSSTLARLKAARRGRACKAIPSAHAAVRAFQYSRWDGTQVGFDLDADALLEEMTDDLLYHGDLNAALRRMLQQGFQDREGRTARGHARDAREAAAAPARGARPLRPRRRLRRHRRAARRDRRPGARRDRPPARTTRGTRATSAARRSLEDLAAGAADGARAAAARPRRSRAASCSSTTGWTTPRASSSRS